mgnify:CR=1 FL=1
MLIIFEKLTNLQSLDGTILSLQKKITQKSEEVHKQYRKSFDQERIELSRLELELKDIEEKLEKSQNRLYSGDVQSGKELTQWKTTMENFEKTKSNLEDQILNQIEKIELLSIKEKEKEHHLLLQRLERNIENLNNDIEKLKSDFAYNLQQRNNSALDIPIEILTLYEELRKKFLNPVVEMDDDTCQGCHLALPSSIAKRVRKKEELLQCPNCKRLIFFK